ncbi:MAG TPA: NAD(P)-dependent alcohol dehydrogenase [Polyangiaceae bacterium]
MRAYATDRHGDIQDLKLRDDIAKPTPAPSELLVKVKAASVSPADLKVLTGRDGGGFLHASKFPLILGFDFSGVVVEVGSAAAGRAVGDEVFGFLPYARSTRGGTFAEYVAVAADSVGTKPKTLSHEAAAAAATSTATALQALRDKGKLVAGQTVLINGASGGVGSYAVQVAKALGATVVATASAAKAEHVKSLGADRVIDYKATPLSEIKERFNVVLDVASTSSFGVCAPLLEASGTYVSLLPSPSLFLGMGRALFSSKHCTFVVVKPLTSDFDQVAAWFDEGKLKPILDTTYPLADLPKALERLRAGDVRGKIAITVDGG